MKTKKFATLILSIIMIVTIFSTSSFASPELDMAEEAVTEAATLSGSDGYLYLNYDSLNLGTGQTVVLVPDLTANGAEVGEYTWTSSDENVVTVDENGNVTAVAPGNATITVKGEAIDLTWYGWIFSASCDVEVALSATIDTGETVNLFDNDDDGFYDISTADELYAFAALVNGGRTSINAELTNNITVNSGTMSESSTNARVWTPIGNGDNIYTGTFDGNGFYVSGLYFSDADTIRVGLFGRLNGTVQNVGVVNSYFYALTIVGGVVGQMNSGMVQNCYNGSTVIAIGAERIAMCGGIVGDVYNHSNKTHIINCYNYGTVVNSDSDGYAGGIVSSVDNGMYFTITNCYNSGIVSGNKDVGAIVGFVTANSLKAYNCYYLAGTASKAFGRGNMASDSTITEKEAEAFSSGEVAYLLGEAFGQKIGTDSFPVLGGDKVYKYADVYSNKSLSEGVTGSCGDNATWFYDDTIQTLIILGTGAMNTYTSDSEQPWYAYADSIETVVVTDGITSIGGYCFSDFANLTTVTIADSVTDFDGYYAFAYCPMLKTVKLSAGLTKIPEMAFYKCTGLEAITIPDGVTEIGEDAFWGCSSLKTVEMPEKLTKIGQSAFGWCSSLSSISLEHVTYIERNAFNFCSSLTSVSLESATYIGQSAFESCTKLTTVTLSDKLDDMRARAFQECGLTEIKIPKGITTITVHVFEGCSSLKSVILPNTVEHIALYAFYGCDSISIVHYFGTEEEWNSITFSTYNDGIVNATRHYCTEKDVIDDTCQTAGQESGWYCDTCAKFIVGGETIAVNPDNHSFQNGICAYCDICQDAVLNDDIYEISNAGQLMWFSQFVNSGNFTAKAVLVDNIDMNGISWTPIGTETPYTGTFNGGGYAINNLWQNAGGADSARDGLIVILGSGGKVHDLTVDSAIVWGASYYGTNGTGVIAIRNSGTISNCVIKNSSVQQGAYEYLGGIAGVNEESGVIENCAVIDTSFSRRWGGVDSGSMGGIVQTNNGTVKNCYTYDCRFNNGRAEKGAVVSIGNAPENCYYYTTSDVASTYAEAKTAEAFASGEVAYLLGEAFGQTVGKDAYPVLGGEKVLLTDGIYHNEIKDFAIILTGKADTKATATVTLLTAGTYTLVFADYEGGRLNGIDFVSVTAESDNTVVNVPSEIDITLGTGDKIMLFGDMTSLVPLCEAYTK